VQESATQASMPQGVDGDAAQDKPSLIELTAVVKWFDVSKGYGFMVPDNGLPDVLLHMDCVRKSGYQTAYEGAKIVAEVFWLPRGLRVSRILSMTEPATVPSFVVGRPRTHPEVVATSDVEPVTVKWFNRLRGFGFLERGFGMTGLKPGQVVRVRFGSGPKGPAVVEIYEDTGESSRLS
jgi:CspA family cold shock protein